MSKVVRNKEQINATVTPYLKKKCMEIAEGPDFTSVSDIVSQALSEFITKYDKEKNKEAKKHEENFEETIIWILFNTEEGKDLLESFFKSNPKLMSDTKELWNCNNPKLLEGYKTKYFSIKEKSSTER
jgi:two-component system, sensor histidine kinase PdtaS